MHVSGRVPDEEVDELQRRWSTDEVYRRKQGSPAERRCA